MGYYHLGAWLGRPYRYACIKLPSRFSSILERIDKRRFVWRHEKRDFAKRYFGKRNYWYAGLDAFITNQRPSWRRWGTVWGDYCPVTIDLKPVFGKDYFEHCCETDVHYPRAPYEYLKPDYRTQANRYWMGRGKIGRKPDLYRYYKYTAKDAEAVMAVKAMCLLDYEARKMMRNA